MRKVLITGAGGFVGSCLRRYLHGVRFEFILTDRKSVNPVVHAFDLEDPAPTRALLDRERPDVIVHLAGNKNVFFLEDNPGFSSRVNVDLTRQLCELAADRDIHFIYLSTDYVFDGHSAPFDERSEPDPQTVYGRDKLAAERCVRERLPITTVLRSAGVFGSQGDFVDRVRSTLAGGERFPAFVNLWNSPTFAGDLFEMIRISIEKRVTGTLHACGSESVSRFDFARRIAEAFGLDADLVAESRKDDIRPDDLTLNGEDAYRILGYRPPGLVEIIRANRAIWD